MEFSLDTNPIITQFRPREGQWELTEDNINRVDPDTKQTILHNYCQYIDSTPLEVFEYLIKIKGCDINLQDGDNDTPVHIAFWRIQPNDDINILTYFLHLNDINVNIRGQYGFTLLHCACTNINTLQLETFKYLIEIKGADINVQDDRNQTPLHCAIFQFNPNDGNLTTLIYLLTLDGINANLKDDHDVTLLHMACFHINTLPLDVFKSLVETNGGDVNTLDENNLTPICRAIHEFDTNYGGDVTILRYLLSRNDINVRTKGVNGVTLLHIACLCINKLPFDVFQRLIEMNDGNVIEQDRNRDTPVYLALCQFNINCGGDVNVITHLLSQKCVNVNSEDSNGNTLLHIACRCIGALPIEVFKLLIELKGGDINVKNHSNMTPLDSALIHFFRGCDGNILTYLLSQNGVNVNTKGQNGRTLLHWACEYINKLPLDVFRHLIEINGGDMNIHDDNNNTPLHVAISFFGSEIGDINVLTYLINQDSVEMAKGHTLLHLVCGLRKRDPPKSDTHGSQIAEQLVENLIQSILEEGC
jgi:ankyrin repeat protein